MDLQAITNPELIKEWGALGAVGIMGIICLLGIVASVWMTIKMLNRQDKAQENWIVSVESMVSSFEQSVEKLFQASDKTARTCSKSMDDVHKSLDKHTDALAHVKCRKQA